MKKSYSELLKSPRWQKKRLEICEAANWKCENCGDKEQPLHVHHGAYLKGKKPWEYPDGMLHCLCESCHTQAEEAMEEIKTELGSIHPGNYEHLVYILDALVEFPLATKTLQKAVLSFAYLSGLDTDVMVQVATLSHERNQFRLDYLAATEGLKSKKEKRG